MKRETYEGYHELLERVDTARRALTRTYIAENLLRFATAFGGLLLVL